MLAFVLDILMVILSSNAKKLHNTYFLSLILKHLIFQFNPVILKFPNPVCDQGVDF